mmetsp:Transcript_87233/g.154530  ORF Transcript_87233/g.154530 Transcript_87233/m.154530 type:complete len:455 (+) Transcript_87233:135-1499(+)
MTADETQTLGIQGQSYGTEAQAERETGSWIETLRVLLCSGAGLLADGYDLSVINLAIALMGELYPVSMDSWGQGLAVSSTMAGIIIGMVSFGAFADFAGRKCASICTALLTLLGAICSACIIDNKRMDLAIQLACCRFFLGLGIGGEYPLSAALGSEATFSQSKCLVCSRSQTLVANMLFMNTGYVLQAVVFLILLSTSSLDMVWRIAFACGGVPSFVVLILRAWMPEPRSDTTQQRSLSALRMDLSAEFQKKTSLMVSVCICWALFNVVSYSLMSFSHVICEEIFPSDNRTVVQVVRRDAVYAMCLSMVGCLTYAVLFIKVDQEMSMKHVQLFGFSAGALLLTFAAALAPTAMIAVQVTTYALITVACSLLGASTYFLPTQGFPASVRGTVVGLAAASGKMGALLGTAFFPYATSKFGLPMVIAMSSSTMLVGAVVTFFCVPGQVQNSKSGNA